MTETRAVRAAERTRRRIDAIRFGLLALAIALLIASVMLIEPEISDRTSLQLLITLPLPFGLWVVSRSIPLLLFGLLAALVSLGLGVTSVTRHEPSNPEGGVDEDHR